MKKKLIICLVAALSLSGCGTGETENANVAVEGESKADVIEVKSVDLDTVDISSLKRITIEELVQKTKTVETDNTIGGITGQITNSRMLIPYNNGVFAGLGFTVTKNSDNVTLKDDKNEIVVGFYDDFFTLNGEKVECEVPQQYIDDVLYIPVRAIAESFGAVVDWNAETKTASVTYGTKVTELVYSVPLKVQVMESYMDVINREGNGGDVRYCLYDFDGDGISELVAYNDESYVLCTYINDELSDYTGDVDFSLISERHKADDYDYLKTTLSNISDDGVVYLVPTEQDFKDLEDELDGDLACHWEYDCKNTFEDTYSYDGIPDYRTAMEMAATPLRDSMESVEFRIMPEGKEYEWAYFNRIKADVLDGIVINKFNIKINRTPNEMFYYKDGYYYCCLEAFRSVYCEHTITSHKSVGNGMYLVNVDEKWDYGSSTDTVQENLLVSLKLVNGEKMWSYYVIRDSYEDSNEPIDPSKYVDLRDFAYMDWKYKVDGGYIYFTYNSEDNTLWVTGADDTVVNVNIPSSYKGMRIGGIGLLNEVEDDSAPLGGEPFSNCDKLESVTIQPNGVTYIYKGAFFRCDNLKSVELGSGVEGISRDVFSGCNSLTDVKLPDTLGYLGRNAFRSCDSLKTITLPENITLERSAFSECSSLENVSTPDTLCIGSGAFYDTPWLEKKIAENPLVVAGGCLFYYAGDESVITIPDNVKCIGSWTFAYNSNLQKIIIPESVTEIEDNAFSFEGNLTIVGKRGSVAETCAKDYLVTFVEGN